MLASALRNDYDQPTPNLAKEGEAVSVAKSLFSAEVEKGVIDKAAKKFRHSKELSIEQDANQDDQPVKQEDNVVFDIPSLFRPSYIQGRSVNTLQEWQGCVVSLEGAEFTAMLVDLTRPSHSFEHATIPVSIVDEEDRQKINPGAYFHLIIGFSRGRGGNHEKKTIVYFRKHFPNKIKVGAKAASILSRLRDTYSHTADTQRN